MTLISKVKGYLLSACARLCLLRCKPLVGNFPYRCCFSSSYHYVLLSSSSHASVQNLSCSCLSLRDQLPSGQDVVTGVCPSAPWYDVYLRSHIQLSTVVTLCSPLVQALSMSESSSSIPSRRDMPPAITLNSEQRVLVCLTRWSFICNEALPRRGCVGPVDQLAPIAVHNVKSLRLWLDCEKSQTSNYLARYGTTPESFVPKICGVLRLCTYLTDWCISGSNCALYAW